MINSTQQVTQTIITGYTSTTTEISTVGALSRPMSKLLVALDDSSSDIKHWIDLLRLEILDHGDRNHHRIYHVFIDVC